MLGGLVKKAVAVAVAAGAAFVALICFGGVIYFALSLLVVPLAAAALTFLLFALIATAVVMIFLRKADGEDEEEEDEGSSLTGGLAGRALTLFRNRPILASVATLAGGFIFLRNPALATMVAAAFTEKSRAERHRGRHR
ncbi:hypothetical protein [Brevundimonas sp. A19_0]|uniref:hypothetical protein n=1 Tax=Brevundimonas sp. A19_0 TaxID=2821087 RepID=UPI001AD9ABA9|nr:hypothetical protein [Brevundimonas sp. A19_0]MBO9501286.1 hypothetical protein [Brevundimonas sp. A19_0]